MYYSAGTYESFAHPEKPKDVDKKSAYIIGTGLAGLTAAFYLVRDGQMKGEHIHLLEKFELAGGSCDGRKDVTKGFFMRGGREMDNHFEVMWDTFRDVPSIETPGVSVLDEYYWLNKHDPNYSLCRATVNRGEDAHTDRKFELDKDSALALSKLFLTPEKDLEDKKISDVLPDSFWSTNFWLYWQTMFAFQRWSSVLEMKRYLCRYVHHIDGLPDFSALRFTKYNQYESMILPLVKYLESHGVHIEYGMDVKNVIIDRGQQKGRTSDRLCQGRQRADHRPHRGRSRVYHERLLHRHLMLRRPDSRARSFRHKERRGRVVGYVESHSRAGRARRVRRSGKLLQRR